MSDHTPATQRSSPYDEATRLVEKETGTTATTWRMLDARWDRVAWLTREALGIPHLVNRGQLIREEKRRKEAA